MFKLISISFRKTAAESKSGDKEEKLAEAIAKSNVDRQRLVAQKNDQQAMLAEHFKKKVAISDPSVGMLKSYNYKFRNQRLILH